MKKEGKSINASALAIMVIIALIVIVACGNILVSKLGVSHKALDLTENKVHTLSDGTKEILNDLAAPVVIRYYASRNADYMPDELKLHMKRVDSLLAEYESLSDGKLQVEDLDPQPDTDAEDSANLDGISGQSIDDENLYLGMAISCLDRTEIIPFINPRNETMLEYEISRRIAQVSVTRKPVIGLITPVDQLTGTPGNPLAGQQGQQPWVIYQQLTQMYEVEDLSMTPGEIDPDRYKVLLVFHPADITPEAEFQIDQYILKGGTVIACIDSHSKAVEVLSGGGGNPMMPTPTVSPTSTLPTLMKSWGVEMATDKVVADRIYGSQEPTVLLIPTEGMPQEDDIITQNLPNAVFYIPGGMIKRGGGGVEIATLIRSSQKSGLVDSGPGSRFDPSVARTLKTDDIYYSLVLHLSGNFKTAFPDGDPAAKSEDAAATDSSAEEEKSETADAGESSEPSEETPSKPESLKNAVKKGNVFLISDVDAFYDQVAFNFPRFGNQQLPPQPSNGNSLLFLNLIDQAASSSHLIGSRSRAASVRPFTVFNELSEEAERKVGDEREKFMEKARTAQERVNELLAQRSQGSQLYLTPELETEIRNLREQEVNARKQIRELEKDLRKDKDAISARIIAYNVALVPGLVILIGIGQYVIRRLITRAR